MRGSGKKTSQEFNRGAVCVPPEETGAFFKELGDGYCAASLRYNSGVAADLPAIDGIMKRTGSHVTEHTQGQFGAGDHLYLWVNADAIRSLRALPDIAFVQPYRNWNDPNSIPRMEFRRG